MKKVISIIAIALIIAACGGKKAETETEKEDFGTPDETSSAGTGGADAIAQGEALVKASDCKVCHHQTNKIVGPSHTDVAKKYEFTEANVKYLANKIINGGSGVWGEVPMAAHDVPMDQAEKMARYVLSLDGEKEH
jgi:cytochrome c